MISRPLNIVPTSFQVASIDVVYLGVSGVLHPSESTYELLIRRSPWEDGHTKFEGMSVLESALRGWPNVRIVLTSTLPWHSQLQPALNVASPWVAVRVIGHTFDDLTKRARVLLTGRDGTSRQRSISEDDYWRMRKADVVTTHAQWLRPRSWIAVDDEDILWPAQVRRDQLVLTDGCFGLLEKSTQVRLLSLLHANFGAPNAYAGS